MLRMLCCALVFAALLCGGASASEAVAFEQAAAKATCKKKVKGKCVKPKGGVPGKAKKKPKPIAKVPPRVPENYTPPPKTGGGMADIIATYKSCMYDEGDRLTRALERNLGGNGYLLGNEVCLADAIGLKRYETRSDIEVGSRDGELLEVTALPNLVIAEDLTDMLVYARPWVRDYLILLSRDLEAHFAKKGVSKFTPLRASSLVRSYKDQRRQKNSPASCRTVICSTHTTGSAVDISQNPYRVGTKEREWLRERLHKDRRKGKIVMVEEWFPPHFHIFVLPPEFVPETTEE